MNELRQGEVCLSDELTFQRGKVTAKPGHKILSIMVGMVPDGEPPHPERAMEEIGWTNARAFEVRARNKEGTGMLQTTFLANTMKDAVIDGLRLVRKVFDGDPQVIEFSMVRLGRVTAEGDLAAKKSDTFFGWGCESGVDLDQMVADLPS